jgi:PAS domain S-box-containing protein
MVAADALDAAEAGLIVLDRDHRVTAWNSWFAAASGIAKVEAMGRRMDELFPRDSVARLTAAVAAALDHGASGLLTNRLHGGIFRLRTRGGYPLLHDVCIHPAGPAPFRRCLVQVNDVTAAAHRDDVLRRRQAARYEALAENASDAILTLDADGLVQQANPAALVEFGKPIEEIRGRLARQLFEDPAPWDARWRLVLAGQAPREPLELTCRRGALGLSYLQASFACWQADARTYVTVILRNVDESRAAQAKLQSLNDSLSREAAERAADLARLQALQQSQAVLVAELQHRTRNLIAVVSSIATQTLAASPSLDEFGDQFARRLGALSRVQGLLSRSRQQPITIRALVQLELEALAGEDMSHRIQLAGPDTPLRDSTVETLALALHELATNARKYGAFATDGGRLSVSWRVEDVGRPQLALDWLEEGIRGRAPDNLPQRRGYGRELIERALPYSLDATTRFELGPTTLRCAIALPL